MSDERKRADAALVQSGLAASRERAQRLIAAGLATVNGTRIAKPSQRIAQGDILSVISEPHPFVSRGGLKLEKAIRTFGASPKDLVCMDIGASTGGFTDVLLQNGAKRVFAIDVGAGQLDARLAADSRVKSMEHTNARSLSPDMFDEQPVLAVMDVSFISIRLILPSAFAVLGDAGRMICLIKPQFEVGRSHVGKHGLVTKPEEHIRVLREIADFAPKLGWRVRKLDYSPITGGDGNIEFLAGMLPAALCDTTVTPRQIDELVRLAHRADLSGR